jgi:uncharacterized membrane protein HdeD (DUF308 family)
MESAKNHPRTFEELLQQGAVAGSDILTAAGVAMLVIGVLAILAPLASGVIFDVIFGALLMGVAIVEFVEAVHSGTWQRGVLLGLAGIAALATGLLAIARPLVGLVALTVVFLGYLAFAGVFRIVMAFALPRGTPGRFWGFLSGVVSLVLAYMAIGLLPNISAWLIGTYVGVSLIFAGVARLSLARGVRRATGLLGVPPPAVRGAHA